MPEYTGKCSCGRIEIHLHSELSPEQFQPRSDAASCRFCSQHDGVWISDPNSELRVSSPARTRTERFASEQVEFHFCAECNELVYARFEDVAVVRVALFAAIRDAAPPPATTSFDGETRERGRARRLANWTRLVATQS